MDFERIKRWEFFPEQQVRKYGVHPYKLKNFCRLNSDDREEIREIRVECTEFRFGEEGLYYDDEHQIEEVQVENFEAAARENYIVSNCKFFDLEELKLSDAELAQLMNEHADLDFGVFGHLAYDGQIDSYELKYGQGREDEFPIEFLDHMDREMIKKK